MLHDWKSSAAATLIEAGRAFDIDAFESAMRLKRDSSILYLADTGGGNPRADVDCAGFAVIMASPGAAPKEFLKRPHSETAVLPPWTWEEIRAARAALADCGDLDPGISEEAARARFDIAGGVPRFIFGSPGFSAAYDSTTLSEVENMSFRDLVGSSVKAPKPKLADVIHKLFHMWPGVGVGHPLQWKDGAWYTDYASVHVKKLLEERLDRLDEHESELLLQRLARGVSGLAPLSSLLGSFFEKKAHQLLARRGPQEHLLVRMSPKEDKQGRNLGAEVSVRFEVTETRPLSSLSEAPAAGIYYKPGNANYPGVDAVLCCEEGGKTVVYLFQMSIAESGHPVKESALYDIASKCRNVWPGCALRLTFVVPPSVAEKYQWMQRIADRSTLSPLSFASTSSSSSPSGLAASTSSIHNTSSSGARARTSCDTASSTHFDSSASSPRSDLQVVLKDMEQWRLVLDVCAAKRAC